MVHPGELLGGRWTTTGIYDLGRSFSKIANDCLRVHMQVSDEKSITKISSCCCQSSASRPAASCFPCAGPAGGVGPPSWSSAACSAARLAASRFFLDLLLPIGSCSSKAASSRLGVSRGRSHICTQHVRVTCQLPIQIDSLSMQKHLAYQELLASSSVATWGACRVS